jgi:hypothetical protein
MSQKAALHGLFITRCDNLVPHESDTIDLVLLYPTGNVLVHEHKPLVLSRRIIDDNQPAALVACTARLGQFCL